MIVLDTTNGNEALCKEFRDRIHVSLNLAIKDYKLDLSRPEDLRVIFTALSAVLIDYGNRAGMTFDHLRDGLIICIEAVRAMTERGAKQRVTGDES